MSNNDNLVVDEHYYIGDTSQTSGYTLYNDDRYDYFLRKDQGGTDVFLGEYVTHKTKPMVTSYR